MDFVQLQRAYHERVNQALTRLIDPLPFQSSPLVNAMQYGALLGGKRLRPFLVYATGEMLRAEAASLDAPAAAVECIHAYSLIHDDLPAMDDDALRRGQPTCHIKYGEDTAILAGDALQTLAFTILADQPMPGVSPQDRIAMISELAQASGVAGMCGGQALDLAAEGQSVDLNQLEQIHRHKTGALIRAAVCLGALTAGAAAAMRCRSWISTPTPSDWRFRCRMTSSMWSAIPPFWAKPREPIRRWGKALTRRCWDWITRGPKRRISIAKHWARWRCWRHSRMTRPLCRRWPAL